MASSGLKKMFILQFYIHTKMYQKMFSSKNFFFVIMANVVPYCRLMLFATFYCGRWYIIWADVITHILSFGRCYCHFNYCNRCDTTLHVLFDNGRCYCQVASQNNHFLCLVDGRCCCHVVKWNSHFYIEKWQMLLPCGRWNSHCVICDGRCYSQVADGITTQSGRWYLVDVITKLADG